MILYNISEVTDKTIHYFSLITLRGRRTTHAYSLLSPSPIHVQIHSLTRTQTHVCTHTHAQVQTYIRTHLRALTLVIVPFTPLQSLSRLPLAFSRIDKVARTFPFLSFTFRCTVSRLWRLAFVPHFVESSRD